MEDDFKLIQCVQDFNFLYDKNQSNYKNNEAKENAWLLIAHAVQTDVDYVKRRWHILRNRFSEIRKKNINSPTECASKWPLYKSLEFLDKHVNMRHSYGYTNRKLNQPATHPDTFIKFETVDHPPFIAENKSEFSPSCGPPMSTTICPKVEFNGHIGTSETSSEMAELSSFQSTSTIEDQNDPDLAFMRSMGLLLKDVKNIKKRRLIQSQICSLICDAVQDNSE